MTPTIVPGTVPLLYVRTTGSDDNDGTSPGTAVQTLAAAVKLVAPGSTVFVGPGRYTGLVEIRNVTGSAMFPVQFIADPSGVQTGDPPGNVVLDANGDFAALVIATSPFVAVDGFVLTGAIPQTAPSQLSASAVEVRSGSDHVTVRNCVIGNNVSADGIRVQSPDVLVFNNLIYGAIHGIAVNGGATGVMLVNNTVADSSNIGLSFTLSGGVAPSGATLKNNIVQASHKVSVDVDQGPPSALQGYSADSDLVFQPTFGSNQLRDYLPIRARGATDLNEDAQFVDAAHGDFHLGSTSPAVNAGSSAIDPSLLDALLQRSTSSDGQPDSAPVDIGYHYPAGR